MIWLFERGQEALRLETRFDNDRGDFVLTIVWGDQRLEVHRFRSKEAFETQLRTLEAQLAAEQWTQIGPPAILPDGWKQR
jgi:hypothetical protein